MWYTVHMVDANTVKLQPTTQSNKNNQYLLKVAPNIATVIPVYIHLP